MVKNGFKTAYGIVNAKGVVAGVVSRKDEARKLQAQGFSIRVMPWYAYTDPGCLYGWDSPTFKLCSEAVTL